MAATRRIRAVSFVSLDGVMQAPGAPEEDPSGGFRYGGWTVSFWDETLGDLMQRAMGPDYDLLLGRRTYEIFSAHWPFLDDELARTFNRITKYVAAGPRTRLDWSGSVRLQGDLAQAVRVLQASPGRDLLIQGSGEVLGPLLDADLVDEMTLLVFPVILGKGKRLFRSARSARSWDLQKSARSAAGVVVSTYRRSGEVPVGSFARQEPSQAELDRRTRWALQA